ncbi:MAG: ABC transporter, ATP-binding protein (cluster 2, ribose/xylose/arabinose/galactose) / ABC transporter, ATP-binding protein (cluster 2, ribose/xylose/arabinose/galactose) [uncultured Arthrobacter sp.]|uniref:ABC transporter, ATP-binding protein (Cluster 2, ribose/xylose/arabinose/galactose) / ABC transporter, ATP-binding protein (Cluster 2, ribose/xylose/arabinose/galactose) n=1 Tax=uncultured Arthrobacter sp. TaxID=114050 RepID=A0A6J4J6Q0_9MICC|nr:sugar ABC transporter ATP-binding protein [uncultured Arthrobacter sp.]CAA9270402.1 MAG: ABC transporter, ATP-binding protein (cluster 2, ribose/xylose/arabinose/galactose) / ABC transporter, ATP-binding protein (cluster 2, ribose/xylose/arabinose/galactose) [uncultured Arthrobacter sp.]
MTTDQQIEAEANAPGPVHALEVRGLVKHYPGVKALDGVDLVVHPHEVLGIAGENGAGKSTLLKALVGLVRPDAGEIRVRGEKVRLRSVVDAANHGIGMVFQEQSLVPNLTAAENIVLGSEGQGVRRGIYRWETMRKLAQEQLDKIGSTIDPLARTDTLSFADRQMVEIAKVLRIEERSQHPPVIILDEPTSVLEPKEIETLFTQIRRLREFASVVFVSHRLDEVLEVCDRISVLRGGRSAGEVLAADATPSELHRMMIGSTGSDNHYHDSAAKRPNLPREPMLTVRGLSGKTFRDVDLEVHAGEIVGIVGVHGSGREDLCRALFGAEPTTAGEVTLDGKKLDLSGTRAACAAGVGYVPAERKSEGMVGPMSVADNMTLTKQKSRCTGPLVAPRKQATLVDSWIERLSIRTPHRGTAIQRLSGGNQQKVVLARWLVAGDVRLLLLDHPSRGLDIGARSEVYRLMRELAGSGVATVLLADSLEEAIGMSDRIVVMSDGRMTTEVACPSGGKPTPLDLVKEMV